MAEAQETRNHKSDRGLLSPARYRAPPGPPVALGAALAIWLFAQADLATTLLALLVTALVGAGYVRARKEAHAARAEAEAARARLAEYALGLRASRTSTWAVDHKARSVACSSHAEALTGARLDFETCAAASPKFVHPEDAAAMAATYARCLETGESGPLFLRFLHADGGLRHVSLRLSAQRDPSGELVAILYAATDLSHYHARGMLVAEMIGEAERQLAESRPDLEKLMGRLGLSIEASKVAPESTTVAFGDGQHFRQAGERFMRVLREWESRRAAFGSAVRALQEARVHSDLLSQAASHSADAMIIYDADGHIEWVNPAFEAMTGYSLAEVRGRTTGSLLCGPETDRNAYAAFRARVARGESAACEIVNYTKAGAPFWVDMRGARVTGRDGALRRTIVVHRDLSARRGMEDELRRALEDARQASAAKSQFVANMSHELRTPLNAVIGYAEILQEDLDAHGLADQARDAEGIRIAAMRLLNLINEVLDLSRLETGRLDVLPSETDFAEIVEDAIAANLSLAETNGNVVTFTAPSAPIEGFTDPVKLRQCLSNLISNACKFTANGRVDISVEATGKLVRFVVKDTGVGLAPAQLERLFQPFVQADGSASRKFEGAGLGLAITRRLAQMLGGDVSAESVAGEGATFTLTASLVLGDRGEDSAPADDRARILVIEDDPSALDLALRTVERLGFAGVPAVTAEEGVRLARACEPALILLDVGLPDNDGWSVLAALQSGGNAAHAPVVIVTADEHRARAEASGAAAYLQKPVGRDLLAATVARLARKRPEEVQPPASTPLREVG